MLAFDSDGVGSSDWFHAAGLGAPRLSSHLTVPRVRPAIRVFGLGAAGSAGNRSWSLATAGLDAGAGVREFERLGAGDEALGDGAGLVPHAGLPFAFEPLVVLESGGKGLVEEPEPRIPGSVAFCLMADLDDWAVDDFSRRTRLPTPAPVMLDDENGEEPPGPGRAG